MLNSKLFTLIATFLSVFFILLILKDRPIESELNQEIRELETKIGEVEKNTQDLENKFDYFNSNAYLERQARLKLNLKRPDEKVVYIVKDDTVSSESEEITIKKPNLSKWIDYLLGR